jgi:hypothetical protein
MGTPSIDPDADPANTLPVPTAADSDAFVAECIDTVTRIYPGGDPEIGACMCGACAPELADCFRDEQCFAIFDCATRVGCFGVECYQPQTCMAPIDAAGVSSPSVAMVTAVGDCSDANGCPRAPPLPAP